MTNLNFSKKRKTKIVGTRDNRLNGASDEYPCYEMDKTSIFMFEILEPGRQLWANTAFEGSQFYSIGVPKFYSWVNVISVYVYNDIG